MAKNLLRRLRERLTKGIRHRVTLLGAMMVALLFSAGVLAYTTSQNVFFLLFSLLLASLLVSSFVNRLTLAGLEAELRLPKHPIARRILPCEVVVRNTKSALTTFALEISVDEGEKIYVPALQPGATHIVARNLVWFTRGFQKPLPAEFATRFPFGFSIRRTALRVAVKLPLYPPVAEDPGYPEILDLVFAHQRHSAFAGANEFSHLRSYQHGDSARDIAWAQSARLADFQDPLTRARVAESGSRLEIELDRGGPDFERAVGLAAYLVWELQHRNVSFVFRCGPEKFEVNGALDAYTVLKHLALVPPEPGAAAPHDPEAFPISFRPGFLVLPTRLAGPEHTPSPH